MRKTALKQKQRKNAPKQQVSGDERGFFYCIVHLIFHVRVAVNSNTGPATNKSIV